MAFGPAGAAVAVGAPSGVLLEASETADLVVLGSRGHGGFRGLLLGSASGQVVTCTGTPSIAAGGSLVVSYTTSVASSASGKLVNAVLLTALGGDPRTPADDAAEPNAGAATQGSDKLSAKAAQTASGVPAVAVAAALAAAFLNAAFDFCLGCQIYLILTRIRNA